MLKDDLVYAGHMLDMARKAADKVRGKTRADFDADTSTMISSGTSSPWICLR
jgi:hypothetical protein